MGTGTPWRDLPADYGSWSNTHRRFIRWRDKGLWERLQEILIDDVDDEWLMIDASHANSRKQPERQLEVLSNIGQQIARGNDAIVGVMIESFLEAGRQNVEPGRPLTYGQSITDPCIDWASTEAILNELAGCVSRRRKGELSS